MRSSDDSSFFLYGVGEKPEALTLGSLVLEKYWQPLIARHYTHDMLRYVCRRLIFLLPQLELMGKIGSAMET
jgi:hypothetical protein